MARLKPVAESSGTAVEDPGAFPTAFLSDEAAARVAEPLMPSPLLAPPSAVGALAAKGGSETTAPDTDLVNLEVSSAAADSYTAIL